MSTLHRLPEGFDACDGALVAVEGEVAESLPSIDTILPFLLIGNEAAAHSRDFLKAHGVAAIINVTAKANPHLAYLERRLGTDALLQVAIEDLRSTEIFPQLEPCCDFIDHQRALSRPVLVHCHQVGTLTATVPIVGVGAGLPHPTIFFEVAAAAHIFFPLHKCATNTLILTPPPSLPACLPPCACALRALRGRRA